MKVLEDIETEMRTLGIWDAKEGTFEHWLRHHLSERGLYDRAHAEWVKWGPEEDAPKTLLVLLRRLDHLLEFRPTVKRFGHYASDESAEQGGFHCVHGRPLTNRFASDAVSRIAWQIEMEHARREKMLEMILDWTMVRLDTGALFAKGLHRTVLPGDWTEMAFASNWGWNERGRWPKGRYLTTISYWDEPIAKDEFEII